MADKSGKSAIPPERLALYDKLIATLPGVERKGAGMPYTLCNGHRFSFLSPTGSLFLRLSSTDKENFLKKYKSSATAQHGAVLLEFVEVPEKLFKNFAEMSNYFRASFEYALSLKGK